MSMSSGRRWAAPCGDLPHLWLRPAGAGLPHRHSAPSSTDPRSTSMSSGVRRDRSRSRAAGPCAAHAAPRWSRATRRRPCRRGSRASSRATVRASPPYGSCPDGGQASTGQVERPLLGRVRPVQIHDQQSDVPGNRRGHAVPCGRDVAAIAARPAPGRHPDLVVSPTWTPRRVPSRRRATRAGRTRRRGPRPTRMTPSPGCSAASSGGPSATPTRGPCGTGGGCGGGACHGASWR